MARLRALLVNENIGGHAAMHLNLARALEEHPEVDASFVHVPEKGPWRRLASARLPPLDRLDIDFQQLRFQLAQSLYVRQVLRRRGQPYDVLHFYTQNTALLSVGLCRRRPSVVSTDSTNELHAYQLPYRRPTRWTAAVVAATKPAERRVLFAATMVVAQSQWVATSLIESYGVPEDRLRVIPFGVSVPEPVPRVASDIPQVTFVGSSMDRKGGWRLLDVYRRRLRGRCQLNLVTFDRVPPEPGVEVINDLRPGDDRLHRLLAGTDVFAFPTEVDKSSYAVLEAMAAGVPVVATDMAALPELVGDDAGLLVAPGDDQALGDALVDLLDDDARRHRMGVAARRRVEQRFDARTTTAALLDVFEEACRRHAGDALQPESAGADMKPMA